MTATETPGFDVWSFVLGPAAARDIAIARRVESVEREAADLHRRALRLLDADSAAWPAPVEGMLRRAAELGHTGAMQLLAGCLFSDFEKGRCLATEMDARCLEALGWMMLARDFGATDTAGTVLAMLARLPEHLHPVLFRMPALHMVTLN